MDLSLDKVKSLAWTFSPPNGMNDEDEKLFREWIDKRSIGYIMAIEEAGCRHAHVGILTVANAKALIVKWLHKRNPERYPMDASIWLKSTTWYVGKPDVSTDVETPGMWETWEHYMGKDSKVEKHGVCKEPYEHFLAPNKSPEERRKRDPWPEMTMFEKKFEEFNLPFQTFDDVDNGLAQLAYVHRVVKLPDAAKLKGLTMHLWKFLNKDGTGTIQSIVWHQIENEKSIAVKRKRVDDHYEAELAKIENAEVNEQY